MKILVNEADSQLRSQLKKLLLASGNEVVETTNKTEILTELKKVDPPELAIIDWSLARQDDSIISQIHTLNTPYLRHITILTTEDQKTEIFSKLQAGTDDYLVKPFIPEELQIRIGLVNRLIETQKQHDSQILEQNYDKKDIQDLDLAKGVLSDASFESIFVSSRGFCLNQNLTAQKMFGYTREEAIGRPGTDWIDPSDHEMVTRMMLQGDTIPYEVTGLHKDGSTFPVEIQGRMIKFHGRYIRITAIRDITERKQAERESSSQERYQRALLDNFPFMVWLKDIEGCFLAVNQPFAVAAGFSGPDDLVGKTDLDIWPRDLAQAYRTDDREVMVTRQKKEMEEEVASEGTLKWFETYKSPVFDVDGELLGTVGFSRDITERKQVESKQKELEEQLYQKQKLEALGVMAGGIAHDFNNILAIILSNIELIEPALSKNNSVQGAIQHIKIAIFRARELVKQIISFRAAEKDFEQVNIAVVIDKTLELLRDTIPSSVDILKIIDDECRNLTIHAAPAQIQQVLINLCNNAVYAMNEKGLLEISLSLVNVETEDLQSLDTLPSGAYLNLTVKDNGAGISKDSLEKIFDPFFTTKAVGEGCGIGLSVINGIIKSHAGIITADSVVGQGSTFQIFLPINDKPEIKQEKIPAGKSHRKDERILFVDDEELLGHAMKQAFDHQGFVVTVETNSIRALTLFQNNPEEFDLVITDQTMPGLSGTELIVELLKIRPNLLTILCTGYSGKVSEYEAKKLGVREVCLKPLSLAQLAQTVRRVLDGDMSNSFYQAKPTNI